MDQNGNKINTPGCTLGDSGFSPNSTSVEICDPRRGARGLYDYQSRDPRNTLNCMEENRFRHSTHFNTHQQFMTSSHSRGNVSAQHITAAANTVTERASQSIRNFNSNSRINDFRLDHQGQHGASGSTLPSSYSWYYNTQGPSCNTNQFAQMQRIRNGMPLLQPPGPINAFQPGMLRPGEGCFNQIYQYQYAQPHPSTTADYIPIVPGVAQVQAGCSKEKLQAEVLENPRKMHLNSSTGNMEFDSFQNKPNIIPKTDSPIIGLQSNKSEVSSKTESQKKPSKPTAPVIMIGKRRGGRMLPTGVIKRPKSINPSNTAKVEATTVTSKSDVKSPAWNRYMAEVEQYRNRLCSEEKQNHPLVK